MCSIASGAPVPMKHRTVKASSLLKNTLYCVGEKSISRFAHFGMAEY
jgi:hypothetical protein